MTYKKKLIEVALPLDAINRESAREKSIRHGHPSTLHLWWARRPLAAARAVLWSSLVDDPSARKEEFPTEEDQEIERRRLFDILEELVKWENSNDERVLQAAQREIEKCLDGEPLAILDPFCGGGTIPLEAQRLGLISLGGDLNPVAVLISKALVEIPARFAGQPPVHPLKPGQSRELRTWDRAKGLAQDIRFYADWMRTRAWELIGHLYPKIGLPTEEGGGEATAIAWLWTRTVSCSNPACERVTPLLTTFVLSSRKGKTRYLQPIIEGDSYRFKISTETSGRLGDAKKGLKRGTSGVFECLFCGSVTERDYVAAEGIANRLGTAPVAVVTESDHGRSYLATTEPAPVLERDESGIDVELSRHPRDLWCHNFGLHTVADLLTDRQLTALNTFGGVLSEVREIIERDAQAAGLRSDGVRLRDGGSGATAYADTLLTYLAFAIDRLADRSSTIATWDRSRDTIRNTFARQAIPMTWDFAEANPFSQSTGGWSGAVEWISKVVDRLPAGSGGSIEQREAAARVQEAGHTVVSTDPPYYDNISYSDLSDFFYVWLRRNLEDVWPDELSTLLTPKSEELIANPHRQGSRESAFEYFEAGMARVFAQISEHHNAKYPVTVFYAFKQSEITAEGQVSTGWETFLEGLRSSGLGVSATWPIRTELANRSIAKGTAALASSIVLACRPSPATSPMATRSEFLAALRREFPSAVNLLQVENIAPVDLAQSAIGPGMAIFCQFSKVVEADGSPMTVRTALGLINEVLQEVLSEEETEFDGDTRWALTWFEQHGMNPGKHGDAETLSKAKDTSVSGVEMAGIVRSEDGKVRLLDREELDTSWDPKTDARLTVWEVTQHLIRRMNMSEVDAAELLHHVGPGIGDKARQLAYLLYGICERKSWTKEAVAYNGLIVAWPELARLAATAPAAPTQQTLGEEEWQ